MDVNDANEEGEVTEDGDKEKPENPPQSPRPRRVVLLLHEPSPLVCLIKDRIHDPSYLS